MDFTVTKMDIPSIPEFNFEELKQDLLAKTDKYNNILYNDAEIGLAKKDRADLNKLKKAINDERIRREKEYMQPFNEFKAKVNEILAIIDKPIQAIDAQVKEYERQTMENKKKAIEKLFETQNPYGWLRLDQIYNTKWLNASTSMKSIEEEMQMTFTMIASELKSIETLDYKEQALQTYKETLSMTKTLEKVAALKEFEKITKAEETVVEAKPEKTEEKPQKPEEPKEWLQMEICLNASDFEKFEAWTKANGIDWRLK